MAGLAPPPRPTAQPSPAMQSGAGGDVDGEAPNVSPEEQAQYDKLVGNAMEIIYPQGEGATVSPAVLDQLSGKQDEEAMQVFAQAQPPLQNAPIDNLASTAVMILLTLEDSAAQAQVNLDDAVLYHGGAAILEELAEVAEAAQIHDFSEEELEGALYRGLDLYRISSQRVDPEQLSQEFGQIEQADKAGNLGQLLPGMDQAMQRAG